MMLKPGEFEYVRIPGSSIRAKWKLEASYKDTVSHPRVPGKLAMVVLVADDSIRDLELKAFASRDPKCAVDVVVTQIGP